MYGIDIAHVQLISAGYRYKFVDNRYTKVTIFIRSDGRSDYWCITNTNSSIPNVRRSDCYIIYSGFTFSGNTLFMTLMER